MSDLKQKFTIGKDGLDMGRVVFHNNLNPRAKCGGYWFFDQEKNTMYFYGESYEFGSCSVQDFEKVKDEIQERFKGARIVFVDDKEKALYKILCEDMDELRAMELINENDWV